MQSKLALVILAPYESAWASSYEEAKKKIVAAMGDFVLEIEHIGSTAIPGSMAKPEIDIMVLVKTFGSASSFIAALESVGYVYFKKFETAVPERRYFRLSDGVVPLVHVHILEKKDAFWNDRIDLKSYLLAHPEAVAHYNDAKCRIAEIYAEDRKRYSTEKDKVVQELLAQARQNLK